MSWDMDARTVDLTITSLKKTGHHAHCPTGIENISPSAGVLADKPPKGSSNYRLSFPQGKSIEAHQTWLVVRIMNCFA
jgi:hypothetical protein